MAYLLFIISVANSSDMAAQVETNHPDGGKRERSTRQENAGTRGTKTDDNWKVCATKVKLKSISVIESTVKHCQVEVLENTYTETKLKALVMFNVDKTCRIFCQDDHFVNTKSPVICRFLFDFDIVKQYQLLLEQTHQNTEEHFSICWWSSTHFLSSVIVVHTGWT